MSGSPGYAKILRLRLFNAMISIQALQTRMRENRFAFALVFLSLLVGCRTQDLSSESTRWRLPGTGLSQASGKGSSNANLPHEERQEDIELREKHRVDKLKELELYARAALPLVGMDRAIRVQDLWNRLPRGEFESQVDYHNRITSLLGPGGFFYSPVAPQVIRYDLDREVLRLEFSCHFQLLDNDYHLKVAEDLHQTTYTGQNIFGVRREIDRMTGRIYFFVLENLPGWLKKRQASHEDLENRLSLFVPLKPDQAKAIKEHLGVLWAVSLSLDRVPWTEELHAEPTFRNPFDTHLIECCMGTNLAMVILYDRRTGELIRMLADPDLLDT